MTKERIAKLRQDLLDFNMLSNNQCKELLDELYKAQSRVEFLESVLKEYVDLADRHSKEMKSGVKGLGEGIGALLKSAANATRE